MTDNEIVFQPAVPTQVVHPWLATARTVVANIAGAIIFLGALAGTLLVFAPQVLAAIIDALPADWVAPVTAVFAGIAIVAGAVTRVMAIPGVNEWLTKIKLGAKPAVPANPLEYLNDPKGQ